MQHFATQTRKSWARYFGFLGDCIMLVQGIDESITRTVGAANAPDLTPLSAELAAMQSRVAPYIKKGVAPVVGGAVAAGIGGPRSRRSIRPFRSKEKSALGRMF